MAERLTIDEIIERCSCQLEMFPSNNVIYREREATRAYLQMYRHLLKAEEQGLLIKLPCEIKVRDAIFVIEPENRTGNPKQVYRNTVVGFSHDSIFYQNSNHTPIYSDTFREINQTWFLTREEAERKLSEDNP